MKEILRDGTVQWSSRKGALRGDIPFIIDSRGIAARWDSSTSSLVEEDGTGRLLVSLHPGGITGFAYTEKAFREEDIVQ